MVATNYTPTVVHNLKVKFLHILELNYNQIFYEFLRKSDWLWKRKLNSDITQNTKFWIGHLKPELHSEKWTRRWTLNQILIIKCRNELWKTFWKQNAEPNSESHSEDETQKKTDWTQKTIETKIERLKLINHNGIIGWWITCWLKENYAQQGL